VIAVLAACRPDHGPPRVKRLPQPSKAPALRGDHTPRSPRIASYKIDATFEAKNHTITATETLTWTNPGASAVTTLPFHLYLNAFKNEKSQFMQTSRGTMRGAKATDTGWGWITVESVQIAGVDQKLEYLNPPDETVAQITLAQPVEPGAMIEVSFKFTAQLPEVFARTGYKGEFNLVGQWFPKIGVRVGPPGLEQWACAPLSINTEFFADFGNYDVKLTVPNTYVVAATGVLTGATDSPGLTRTLTYHAEDVHDFVWMADPYMTMTREGYIKDDAHPDDGPPVEVRVYARPEQAEFAHRHLQAAIGSIERFSRYFVPYPWPIMNVIDPPIDAWEGAGGMEYPMFVTTGGDSVFTRGGVRLPEYVTVHEVGHNWFQGILASNEPEEAWLDEGVNEWADLHVMQDLYGQRANAIDWRGWQADTGAARHALRYLLGGNRPLPSPIATAAYEFADSGNYGLATYDETMAALTTLENIVGSAKFLAAMKAYTKAFAFKHPTGRDFYATMQKELGQDLSWFFTPVFQQAGGNLLAVRTASCREAHQPRGVTGEGSQRKITTESEAPDSGTYTCDVVIQNTGTIHVPVEIELRFADGSSLRETWDDRGNGTWKRWQLARSSKLTEVRIDPDHKLMVGVPVEYDRRIEGDGAASLRAGARIASWAQALMQLVGP